MREILKKGFWSNRTISEKSYHKEILVDESKCQASILKL